MLSEGRLTFVESSTTILTFATKEHVRGPFFRRRPRLFGNWRLHNLCHPKSHNINFLGRPQCMNVFLDTTTYMGSPHLYCSIEGVFPGFLFSNQITLPLLFHWAGSIQSHCQGSRVESKMKTGQLVLICYSNLSLNKYKSNRPENQEEYVLW